MRYCPACNIPLCRIAYEDVTVHTCPDCLGALVESPRLKTIQRRRERRWSKRQRRAAAARALQSDRVERLRCPVCLLPMAKQEVSLGDGAFRLDRCGRCDVCWFDAGELDLAQILFEKREDSRTPEEWDRIERAATARMQLETSAAGPDREPGGLGIGRRWPIGRGGRIGAGALSAAFFSSLVAVLVAGEWHDLAGPSDFQRRQAIKRIAFGLALVGAGVLTLYLLILSGCLR